MIYYLIILLVFIFAIYYDFFKKKKNKQIAVLFVIILFVSLAGFRDNIGIDTETYRYWFNYLSIHSGLIYCVTNNKMEPLFVIFNFYIKLLTGSWLISQFLHSLFINIIFLKFIKKHTDFFFTASLLYFLTVYYVLNCEEIRQSTSFAFTLIGINYLDKLKNIKGYLIYYICVLIAIGFHATSVIFLIIPFIPNLFNNKFYVLAFLFFTLIISSYFRDNINSLSQVLDITYLDEQVKIYSNSEYMERATRNINNYLSVGVIKLLIPIYSIYYSGINKKHLLPILLLLYLFFVTANLEVTIFYRFVHIFEIVSIVVLCIGLQKAFSNRKLNIHKVLYMLFLLITIYSAISGIIHGSQNINYLPYKFIFSF